MTSGTLIFLLFVVGLPLAMVLMHRGGHGHGAGGGMGGCGMGHGGHAGHQEGHGHNGADDGHDERPTLGQQSRPSERQQDRQHAGHGHGNC